MKVAVCFSTNSIDCHAVVQRVFLDHPDLNCDMVRMLQTVQLPYSWNARLGSRLLFYWQVWQWVMQGKLITGNADEFLDQELFLKAEN
jgi:hypothetical protein